METKQNRNRLKIFLVVPLMVIPFLALTFYAMGGGKKNIIDHKQFEKGINSTLPDASFKKEEPSDKMGYYQHSNLDSSEKNNSGISDLAKRLGFNNSQEDLQTKTINEKLDALNKEINRPEDPIKKQTAVARAMSDPSIKNDVDRLEALMKTMKVDKGEDVEMAQLSGMMDKIIAIQNPEIARLKVEHASGLDSQFRATPAVIVDNQKVVEGATVKIRLEDTLRVGGMLVPKGQELFGACRITNQRLLLDIKNIRLGTSIIPVDLSVYSLDGMIGIEAPEAMLTGALNNGTDDAMRSIGFGGFDQTIATQVAGAGINAARQLISKKVKNMKVKLKSSYPILLRNNQIQSR